MTFITHQRWDCHHLIQWLPLFPSGTTDTDDHLSSSITVTLDARAGEVIFTRPNIYLLMIAPTCTLGLRINVDQLKTLNYDEGKQNGILRTQTPIAVEWIMGPVN